jgi:hypothetical protein
VPPVGASRQNLRAAEQSVARSGPRASGRYSFVVPTPAALGLPPASLAGIRVEHLLERPALVGFAFDVADLVLLQAWADLYGMRMVVELDQSVDGREHEEIVAIYSKDSGRRRWSLWRSSDGVVVQPIIGRSVHFSTVTDAAQTLWSLGR